MDTDNEEQSQKDAKRAAEENKQMLRDQARRKDTIAREQAIEKSLNARKTRELEKRAAEEPERLAKEEARRKANLMREQAIEKDREDRKLKAKNNTTGF